MARYGVAAPTALGLADLMCCTYMKETERRVDKALVWCVALGVSADTPMDVGCDI